MTRRDRSRGFVLLAVLWVMVGVSAVGLGLAMIGRHAAATAHNRLAMLVAEWAAEDCSSQAQEVIGNALRSAASSPADTAVWTMLDRYAPNATPRGLFVSDTDCTTSLRAAGTTIDVNTANQASLARVFMAAGISAFEADSLVDAILDWRDADQISRPNGAEANWYIANGRVPPRDAPFTDAHEIEHVRGLEPASGLDSLFGVDTDRIVLDRAPLAVLAALPGIGDQALGRIAAIRARGGSIGSLLSFAAMLSPNARDTLIANFPELARRTTVEPDAWLVTSRGWSGTPRVTVIVQLRLVRAGTRAGIVRRRTWVE